MFKYVQNLSVSLCSTSNLSSRKVHDLCSWWYNAHQSLHEEGKHPLWPGDCTDYKLKTQNCSSAIAATVPLPKAEKKEKVFLGGVQHADSRNLDLRIIPQKNTDRLKKFLWTTDWESLLEWTSPGEKTSLSSGTTHRNGRCNKPTIKIENCLPITAHFFGVVCKKKQPKPNTLSWKRSLSSLGTKL